MSAQGRDWAEQNEHTEATAPRTLQRLRAAFRRHGVIVKGDMFIHALEELVKPEPEPTLDAGWPLVNPVVEGKMNR